MGFEIVSESQIPEKTFGRATFEPIRSKRIAGKEVFGKERGLGLAEWQ